MEWKSWIKQYGIHAALCLAAAAVAFGVNREANIERNHRYMLSEPVHTLLREVVEAKIEGDILMLSGWGFDTNYYSESNQYELILRDTETGESFWPKMENVPEPVKIAERYTDGEDYSNAGFAGRIRLDKLAEDCVYEILLRYTSDYINETGNEQQYVKTVTTDEFFYHGEITAYNPKTFVAPVVAGTELEKELESVKLFHYFPEGAWIYYNEAKLYYIVEKRMLREDETIKCILHWYVRNSENLPADRVQYGFGNSDFYFDVRESGYKETENYKMMTVSIPSKSMINVDTAFLFDNNGTGIGIRKQWK